MTRRTRTAPDLATLVDLEWLLRDGAPPAGLDAARERAVAGELLGRHGLGADAARARLDADRSLRQAFASGWLDAVRARREDLPGAVVSHGLDVCGWVLVVLGLVVGAGAAQAFLAYDGSTPVNVLYFAAAFFGLQILLLVAMLWFVVRARRAGRGGGIAWLQRPVAFVARRLLGERGRAAADALRSLGSRQVLYADVERWTVFALAQRFGVAFNVGALVVAAGLIAFSDLVFAWSTTLDVQAGTVHSCVAWIGTPWAWLDGGVPGLDVVEASQWKRMERSFVGGKSLAEALPLAAQWWRFLLAGVVVWGLAPRVVALGFGAWRARRARASLGFDHVGYQELFDRLVPASRGWEGPAPDTVRGPAPVERARPASPEPPAANGVPTWLLVWGRLAEFADDVATGITRRFGAAVAATHAVGGADLGADERAIAALRGAEATRVTLVASAGQQPTAELMGFVRAVRDAIGPARPVVVGLVERRAEGALVDAGEDERAVWKRALAALDDPYLWVETMAVTA